MSLVQGSCEIARGCAIQGCEGDGLMCRGLGKVLKKRRAVRDEACTWWAKVNLGIAKF